MIRAFNAFQIVTLFSVLPFLISWLKASEVAYAGVLSIMSITVWVVMYIGGIVLVTDWMYDNRDK